MVQGLIADYILVRYARFFAWLLAWCLVGFLVALPLGLGWIALATFGVVAWRCHQARLTRQGRQALARAQADYDRMQLQADMTAETLFRQADQRTHHANDGYRYVDAE